MRFSNGARVNLQASSPARQFEKSGCRSSRETRHIPQECGRQGVTTSMWWMHLANAGKILLKQGVDEGGGSL